MRSSRIRKLIIGFVLLGVGIGMWLGGTSLYQTWQVEQAAQQAARDIARGEPQYWNYGEWAPFETEVTAVLRERYGVRLIRVAGCDVDRILERRCDAYNREVSRHFGFVGERDIFLSAVDEFLQTAGKE
jgi:hypothetical protein